MEPANPKGYYTLIDLKVTDGGMCHATLSVDPEHPVFAGHFPGRPVLPGVCMIRMVRETLEWFTSRTFRMESARNVKFLNVLNPNEHPRVRLVFMINSDTGDTTGVEASLEDLSGAIVFFKISANYLPDTP